MLRFAGSLMLGTLLLPAAAVAQTTTPANSGFDRQLRISGRVVAVHDTNALLGARRLVGGGAGTIDTSDQRITPSVVLDIVQPVGRQALFLNGSVGYQFYRRYERFNSERINLQGGANTRFGRCTGQVSGGFARQQSNLGDILLVGAQAIENIETTVNYGADVSCGGQVGLTPSFGYRRIQTKNNTPSRAISNFEADTYTAQVGYARPSLGVISIYGSYRDGRYPDRTLVVAGEPFTDGIEVYTGGVQFERAVTSRLNGRVAVGYTHVKPKGVGVEDFKGLAYDARVFYAAERLSVTLVGRRAAEQSNLLNISYQIETGADVNLTYALTPRLSLIGGGGYSHRLFRSSPLVPIALVRGSEDTYRANAGIRYRFTPGIGLTLSVDREIRNSTSNLLDYKTTRISAAAEVVL